MIGKLKRDRIALLRVYRVTVCSPWRTQRGRWRHIMHIKDIPEMVDSGNLDEVERAFRALVAYPCEEEVGGANSKNLMSALDALSRVLLTDLNAMPPQTCAALRLRVGSTYREGAGDFQAHHTWWHGRLNAVCGGH